MMMMTNTAHPRRGSSAARRAFTVVEASLVLIIIALLASVILVGLNKSIVGARKAAEQQFLVSIRIGCDKFEKDFDFLPPLIDDKHSGGAIDAQDRLLVRSDAFLADPDVNGPGGGADSEGMRNRYSEFSIATYLVGSCDKTIDGVDGLAFTKPRKPFVDGANEVAEFSKRGARIEPLIDLTKGRNRSLRDTSTALPQNNKLTRAVDRWNTPVRYYRWEKTYFSSGAQKDEVEDYGVPPGAFTVEVWKAIIADSSMFPLTGAAQRKKASDLAVRIAPELAAARFAVVSAGPDGLINESPGTAVEAKQNLDNLVEVDQ